MMAPEHLRCEHLDAPLGVDVQRPRLSWHARSERRGAAQAAYRIVCSKSREAAVEGRGEVWDSGRVASSSNVLVPYGGEVLRSFCLYWWSVRTWDGEGHESPWSRAACFGTGLIPPDSWSSSWISMREPAWSPTSVLVVDSSINQGAQVEARQYWAMYLRRRFEAAAAPRRAVACVCGLGYYELLVNGTRVGTHRLDPAQTDYHQVALYSTYDVTEALRSGPNVIQIVLANGRYVDAYGFGQPRCTLILVMDANDGSRTTLGTDESWRCSHGPILQNGIYEGELYDAREELPRWSEPEYDDSSWQKAVTVDGHPLASQLMQPIVARTELPARSVASPKPDTYVFDFGQNLSGVVRLRARGSRGTTITLRFAELLADDGTLNLGTTREAGACDTFILKGEGTEVFEPRFTYHGFRYAECAGYPGVPSLEDACAVVIHTGVPQTGSFLCSDGLVNRIHENVLWGQRSNLMSAPTDCPQRGERMGWLGDAQLASEEAVYNFDMAAFYTKYLHDIRRAQHEDGSLSDVVPAYWSLYPADPAWGAAYVVLAWALYQHYGDRDILAGHYNGMRRYVDFLDSRAENHIVRTLGKYGDWCPPASTFPKKTPIELTSTWFLYHDTLLFSRIAGVLGRESDERAYGARAREILDAFNRFFLKGEGRYATLAMSPMDRQPGQTSQALPLYLDMVPPDQKEKAIDALLKAVVEIGDRHLDTGIIGTRFLFEVLRDTGHAELAFQVATQKSYPGWGYMIAEGATTVWERWEKLSGTGMNSHNHIMFGTIDAWFYRTIAGIIPTSPGWRTVRVQPWPVGGLSHAAARVMTPHGPLMVRWDRSPGELRLHLAVPVGAEAEVRIPRLSGPVRLLEGGRVWGPGGADETDGWLSVRVGSGSYDFQEESDT